jgi:hypothetical protein
MRSGLQRPACRILSLASLFVSLAAAVLIPAALAPAARAQAAAAASSGPALSRVDIFGGYTYFSPYASTVDYIPYAKIKYGAVGSVSGYFGRTFGLQLEGQDSPNGPSDNNCAYTAQAGPIARFQKGRFVPFAHALGGAAIVGGPRGQLCNTWGYGVTGGLGLDIILPIFHDHIALRPIQADFMWSKVNYGPVTANGFYGGDNQIYAVRGSAGIVFRLGNLKPESAVIPPFNCSADPGNPFPGDPVTISSSVIDVNPKHHPTYIWTSTGGKIVGAGASAAVDTATMEPGTYNVEGKLVEGDKQRLVASCTTSFTVRPFEPPTLSCAADKAAINSGDTVVITASGRSPQNRPLTYSYASSGGLITGTGPTATLSTAGATPGNITVTCRVLDDKGQSAVATTSIVVATPAPPAQAAPTIQNLCGITFDRDLRRPDRVDNEAKGCLDDVALTLQRESGDKLLIVGSHAPNETNRNAAERAMNAAQYLTAEKGIDPARLDLRIGPDNTRSVAMMLVPPGATVDAASGSSFDTSSVKRSGQAYGKPGAPAHRPVRRKRKPKKPAPLTFN